MALRDGGCAVAKFLESRVWGKVEEGSIPLYLETPDLPYTFLESLSAKYQLDPFSSFELTQYRRLTDSSASSPFLRYRNTLTYFGKY